MSECRDSICPLCLEAVPREHLHDHIALEQSRARERTVLVIQSYHPDWLEVHGACAACWKAYREASQVIRILKTRHKAPMNIILKFDSEITHAGQGVDFAE